MLDRPKLPASAESTPASSAPGGDEDGAPSSRSEAIRKLETMLQRQKIAAARRRCLVRFCSLLRSHRSKQSRRRLVLKPMYKPATEAPNEHQPQSAKQGDQAAAKSNTTSTQASIDSNKHPRSNAPRPPIPARSGSVSPLTASKDRF